MKRLAIVLIFLLLFSKGVLCQPQYSDTLSYIHPYWSPDGQHIAFASAIENNFDIFAINSRKNKVRQVSSQPADDYYPAWSPNGNYIA